MINRHTEYLGGNSNLYWTIYKSLEKELLTLSEIIHIDDSQLDVYSIRIADLLVRTAVEIESIAKELYFRNGGEKVDDNTLHFDSDCMCFLNEKWLLNEKVVIVTSPYFHFRKSENIELIPLKRVHKRGTQDWVKAYQAIKHHRVKELKTGSLKFFMRSLAALYILNLYYRDAVYELETNDKSAFDATVGSEVFSVKVCVSENVVSNKFVKYSPFNDCIYLIGPTKDSMQVAVDLKREAEEEANNQLRNWYYNHVEKNGIPNEKFNKVLMEKISSKKDQFLTTALLKRNNEMLGALRKLKYEAVLNKNQY